jgi:methyl-accepting chemotaxis protein
MSPALQVALFAASLTFIVLALCIIPVAFHLRRKLEQLVITVGELKEKLQLLAEDSHTMVQNVTEVSKRANQQLDEISHVVQTARQWTERVDRLVNEVGSAIEPPVHSMVRKMNLFRTGVATFLQVLSHRNQHNQTKKEQDHV